VKNWSQSLRFQTQLVTATRWNLLRNVEGVLDENVQAALEPAMRACVIVADTNEQMSEYVRERLTTLRYDCIVATDPIDLHGHLYSQRGDLVLFDYGVAAADNHRLPSDIFARHKLPIIAYGHDIPLNTNELRKMCIHDVIRGLPTEKELEGVLERWKPIQGMDDPFFNRSAKWTKKDESKSLETMSGSSAGGGGGGVEAAEGGEKEGGGQGRRRSGTFSRYFGGGKAEKGRSSPTRSWTGVKGRGGGGPPSPRARAQSVGAVSFARDNARGSLKVPGHPPGFDAGSPSAHSAQPHETRRKSQEGRFNGSTAPRWGAVQVESS
jgi:hypothetical protein